MSVGTLRLPAPEVDDGDHLARERGIHRLAVPTPMVGTVNSYLIVDRPLTLVDAATNWGGSLDGLQAGLHALGYAIEDIELLILTHQHVDHIGLAEIVSGRAGADVACHEQLGVWLAGYPGSLEEDDAWTGERLAAHGVPSTELEAYRARLEVIRTFGSRPQPTLILRDGDELHLRGRTLRFLLRPGHSPTDTVIDDLANGVQFTADHVMSDAWTTPYLRPGDADWRADLDPARRLRESLRETERVCDAALGLPGHGRPFSDVRGQAQSVLARQQRRATRLLPHLDEPRSAHELRLRAFPNLTPARSFLGVLEVLAQLSILVDEGLAEHVEDNVPRFVATGAPGEQDTTID